MKKAFVLGAWVRQKGSSHRGKLVSMDEPRYGTAYPHYAGEGFYCVELESTGKKLMFSEDDLELDEPVCEEEPITCGVCGGDVGILGVLGRRTHYQCRNCGIESSKVVDGP